VLSELNPVLSDPQVKIFVVNFVISMVFMAKQLVFIHTLYGDLELIHVCRTYCDPWCGSS
jgi:hypothetical protein